MAKPTILAFHGSGSNGTIHTVQLARISRFLKSHFDIEALTGPIPSSAGPGILPFFEGCGPYYRWIPPSEQLNAPTLTMTPELEFLLLATVEAVRARGSRVVGLIGFSQGTRVVAGLLKGAQIQRALKEEGKEGARGMEWLDGVGWGVSVCTSFPPVPVPPSIETAVKASGLHEERQKELLETKVEMPTLHVLGKQDQWMWAGRAMVEQVFGGAAGEVENGKVGVYEFNNMGHHYPVPVEDTQKVAEWVLKTWEGTEKAP